MKRWTVFVIILLLLAGTGVGIAQTPPGPNTIQHDEGINFPTITATDGYFYGAQNITDWIYNADPSGDAQYNSVNLSEIYWNDVNRTDVLANPEAHASYIIFKDDTYCYAKNGTTGQIDYRNTDATIVFQSCINDMPSSYPGLIYVREGNFVVGSLTITKAFTLKGSGMGSTRLLLANNSNDYLLKYVPTSTIYHPIVIDIKLGGNGAYQSGGGCIFANGDTVDGQLIRIFTNWGKENNVYIENAWGWKIQNSLFENSFNKGLRIEGGSQYYVTDNFFSYCDGIALQTNTGTGAVIKGNYFNTNENYGLYLNRLDYAVISANIFKGCSAPPNTGLYDAIYVANSADYNIIDSNVIYGNSYTKNGINIISGTGNTISSNSITGITGTPIINSGTNTKLYNNFGYLGYDSSQSINWVNATEFYLNGANYTALIESLILAGANPFDQDLNTTDNVSFASVNATDEFYRAGANYTAWIESIVTAGGNPFDQSLNTTDSPTFDDLTLTGNLTANGVDVDWIDLGGENRTSWPTGGGSAMAAAGYDYYWTKSGSTYTWVDSSGNNGSGSDFDSLLSSILSTDSYTGRHYFGPYTFVYNSDIELIGDGASYGRHLIFQGAGAGVTTFQASGSVSFKPHKGIAWDLFGITFDLDSGDGIHGYDDGTAGAYGECCLFRSTWDDLEFITGSDGINAVYLENPEWLLWGNTRFYVNSGVRPIYIRQTDATYKYGDVQFRGIVTIWFSGDNNTGMLFQGYDDDERLNLFGGNGKIWIKASSGSNTTGIWLDYVENWNLGKIQVDGGCTTLVHVNHSFGGILDGGMYTSTVIDGGYGFRIASGGYGTYIKDWVLYGEGTIEWADQNCSSPNNYVKFDGICLWTNSGTFTENVDGATDFERLYKRGGGTYPVRFPT